MANNTDLIDSIQEVRTANNKLWMDLVRLAIEATPTQAKAILRQIRVNDLKVSELMGELGRE
jgi:hypothetical protein